jgi:CRISPR type I-E-associated protein CasB/Cse2
MTPLHATISPSIKKFIFELESMKGPEGRANLAELRRAAADPLGDYRTMRILGNLIPDTKNEWAFDAYRLTAILYALHRQGNEEKSLQGFGSETTRRSFGASLNRLRGQLRSGKDSLDLRFSALLDTPAEDLAVPLRGFVLRCASAETLVPIDYTILLKDLLYWEGDYTRRTWARHYWQSSVDENTNDFTEA